MNAPPPTIAAMAWATPRAVDDAGRQHAVEAESALEGERHEDEDGDAEQAGIEDGLERVGAGSLNSLV